MVINRWFPVKFSIWIQREMISGQGTDKKILQIHRELQSDFLSLLCHQLHQQTSGGSVEILCRVATLGL